MENSIHSWANLYLPETQVLRRLKEEHKFKASLGYTVRDMIHMIHSDILLPPFFPFSF